MDLGSGHTLVVLIALALLLPAGAVLAQPGNGNGPENPGRGQGGPDNGSDTNTTTPPEGNATGSNGTAPPEDDSTGPSGGPSDEDSRGPPDHARGKGGNKTASPSDEGPPGKGRGKGQGPTQGPYGGKVALTASGVSGRHVSFDLTRDGIEDYTVGGVLVLESLTYEPALGAEGVEAKGARFEAKGENGTFEGVDNPTGTFKARADGAITLVLAPGLTAEPLGNSSEKLRVNATEGNFTGILHVKGGYTLDGATILGGSDVRFHATSIGLWAPKVRQAVEDGRVGGEVVLSRGENGSEAVSMSYGDVNVTVLPERAQGRLDVLVEGHGKGRTIVFHLEEGALAHGQGQAKGLLVLFDGELIGQADDLEDALNITAGEDAEYALVQTGNGTQVLVQVPHFSPHEISIQSVGATVANAWTGSAGVFVAAALAAMVVAGGAWYARYQNR